MAKGFFLILMLSSFSIRGGDTGGNSMMSARPFRLLIYAGLILNTWALTTDPVLASNITAHNSTETDPPILATSYFVWWSTWLGNALGITDVFGWVLDWIVSYVYYIKGNSKEVIKVKEEIAELKKKHHKRRNEELQVALNACDIIIEHLENPDSGISREEVIACLKPISLAMLLEAELSDVTEETKSLKENQ